MRFFAIIVHYGFGILAFGLLVYVLCAWIDHRNAQALRRWLAQWYEPLLAPIRRAIPAPIVGHTAVDLSPVVLYLALVLVKQFILSILLPPF